MIYHINDKGEAGKCSARQGQCPFGDDGQHFSSPEAAREAYEIGKLPLESLKKDSRIYSADEVKTLLRKLSSNDPYPIAIKNFIRLYGPRPGETPTTDKTPFGEILVEKVSQSRRLNFAGPAEGGEKNHIIFTLNGVHYRIDGVNSGNGWGVTWENPRLAEDPG